MVLVVASPGLTLNRALPSPSPATVRTGGTRKKKVRTEPPITHPLDRWQTIGQGESEVSGAGQEMDPRDRGHGRMACLLL